MKKLLFIIFFPITLPIYLLYKFFIWIGDTFIPFLQFDVFPLFTDKLFPVIKRYCKEKSAEMGKNSKRDLANADNSTETIEHSDFSPEQLPKKHAESDRKTLVADGTVDNELKLSCSINTGMSDIIKHPPPYTREEYETIRKAETEQQCNTLKKCYNTNDFESQLSCAQIYDFWGSSYRWLAIHHFNRCIELIKHTGCIELVDGRKYIKFGECMYSYNIYSNIYSRLGYLYEGCRDFENAINAYNNAIENRPELPTAYVEVADCLRKQNEINKAIDFLEKVKTTNYYISPEPHSCFVSVIDKHLNELYKKKEKGYIYRPRKDDLRYVDYSMSIDDICNTYLQKNSIK